MTIRIKTISILVVLILVIHPGFSLDASISGTRSVNYTYSTALEIDMNYVSGGSHNCRFSLSSLTYTSSGSTGQGIYEIIYGSGFTLLSSTFYGTSGSSNTSYSIKQAQNLWFATESYNTANCSATVGWNFAY